MKIKDGFLLRNVADRYIVVPVGEDLDFSGMLTLNDTSVFIWNLLKNDITKEELLESVINEYEIDKKTATEDVDELLNKFYELKLMEDQN